MATILHKNSLTTGKTPLGSELSLGEIAINSNDGRIFTKRVDGTVVSMTYQNWTTQTASYTLKPNDGVFIDTSTSQITLTLPSVNKVGDIISIVDIGMSLNANKLIVTSGNISGVLGNLVVSDNGVSFKLVFDGTNWNIMDFKKQENPFHTFHDGGKSNMIPQTIIDGGSTSISSYPIVTSIINGSGA